jgi:hypothetical protein
MAADRYNRFLRNLNVLGKPGPSIFLGSFQAGATQAIDFGEIISLTADTNTDWEPVGDSVSGASNIAMANCKIESGDAAGYYEIAVPCPGDVFWFDIETAAATALGTALYSHTSEILSAAGSNQLATSVGYDHYPQVQGRLTRGHIMDHGTSITSKGSVDATFKASTSYYAALQA